MLTRWRNQRRLQEAQVQQLERLQLATGLGSCAPNGIYVILNNLKALLRFQAASFCVSGTQLKAELTVTISKKK